MCLDGQPTDTFRLMVIVVEGCWKGAKRDAHLA